MEKTRSRFTLVIALAAASAAAFAQAPPAPDMQEMHTKMNARFSAADADHDGKLTREEAAKMPMVARNFAQIDKAKKGYVTLEDVQAFARERAAARRAAKAAPTT
jgi:Ca2+-binding EF-hand superfamily protein